MANNSCARIGYRVSAGCIFCNIKAIGQRCPLYFPCAHRCASVAPTQSLKSLRVQLIRLLGVHGTQMCRIDHCLLQRVECSLVYSCLLPLKVCFNHRGQRGRHSLESFDKLLVKSTQPDKLSNLMNSRWRRRTSNDLDLFSVHVYSIFIDDVSAKPDSSLEERGFINAG